MNQPFSLQNAILLVVLGALIILTFWMQFILLQKPDNKTDEMLSDDPDYYVENFTTTGLDNNGQQYLLEASRLVHYPKDNKALLDKPHLVQMQPDSNPTHIYADSGWLFANGSEILLTDNVKVIRSKGQKLGGAATSRRMRIKLKSNDR